MFIHSVRVPRLYKTASKIVQQVKENGASLKDLLYKKKHPNLKGIYSLVLSVLKNGDKLDHIIRNTQILIKETRLDPWLARVLITELLWGKGRLNGDCKPFQTIFSYKSQLTDSLKTLPDVDVPQKTRKVNKPRYARVNTLKLTVSEAVETFRNEGWTLVKCGNNTDYAAFLATVASLSEDQFIIDMHIQELLIFPPNTEFYQHHFYLDGCVILQDKASCLAPMLLSPETDGNVLDMCSAPGMKASQLAGLVGQSGKIYAVERDQRRYETLCKLIAQMGIENVKCINKDVLTLSAKEFPDVEYILVDPSCSGSGMLDRFEFENPESKCNQSRLQSLAGFQITILRHALLNFPKVRRVIYSTCSLYPEENEEVVHQVISSVRQFRLVNLRDKMRAKWFNFGSEDFGELGQSCVYAKPEQDLTNGFFVAMFERIEDDEINKYFVKQVRRTSECENVDKSGEEQIEGGENDQSKNDRKRYKRNRLENVAEDVQSNRENTQNDDLDNENMEQGAVTNDGTKDGERKKKKKGKKKQAEQSMEQVETELNTSVTETEPSGKKSKKNKKKKCQNDGQTNESVELQDEVNDSNIREGTKKCKKSKKEKSKNADNELCISDETLQPNTKKSKKRTRKDSELSKTDGADNAAEEIGTKKTRK